MQSVYFKLQTKTTTTLLDQPYKLSSFSSFPSFFFFFSFFLFSSFFFSSSFFLFSSSSSSFFSFFLFSFFFLNKFQFTQEFRPSDENPECASWES
jgi:hypothetical protein